MDTKSIADTLKRDLRKSKDVQVLLPYWKAEEFLFQPEEWRHLLWRNEQQFKTKLEEKLKEFCKVRVVSLKLHYPTLTEEDLLTRVEKLMKKIVRDFPQKETKKYLDFWAKVWENKALRDCCPEFFDMCEIFYAESPANVFSESMGRLTNMIRSTLKNRMGDSLIDALLRTYKNSGHLEFWETHLDNLFHCHRNLMNCSSSVPIWPHRFKAKKNPCAKAFNFNPEPPKTRSSKI